MWRLATSRLSRVASAPRAWRESLCTVTDERVAGTCKWFDATKGYGFIEREGYDDQDCFVHQTEINAPGFRSLAEGEPVEFDVVLDERGRARAVRVTGPDGAQVKGAPRADPTPSFD